MRIIILKNLSKIENLINNYHAANICIYKMRKNYLTRNILAFKVSYIFVLSTFSVPTKN